MRGPIRELLPVGGQRVRVRLPDGVKPSNVQLLVANQKPRVAWSAGHVEVTVPSILDHEVVAIDL